jgi:hypothetical protein
MRARITQNLGVPAVVAIALTVVTLYCLWGVTLLRYGKEAGAPQAQVALNR